MDGHENDILDGTAPANPTEPVAPAMSETPEIPTTPAAGGIFSGSDTRIETENLPENLPTAVQPAPASAITPANRTTSTVTGDLKLGGAPKKKKWPLVVVGIVTAVAIIVVGVWLLLSDHKNQEGTKDNVKIALNQFSNYYLYGTDSSDNIQGNYSKSTVYEVDTALEEGDTDFFNKSKNYYDSFIKLYEQALRSSQEISGSESIDDYTNGDVSSFTQMFDFVYRLAMSPALTSEEIFGAFANMGFEGAEKFISDYYSNLLDTSYDMGTRYAKERTIYDLAQLDQLRIYKDNNCIEGEGIKEDCVVTSKNYDMSRIQEAEKIANSDILELPNEVVENSIMQLYLIQKEEL